MQPGGLGEKSREQEEIAWNALACFVLDNLRGKGLRVRRCSLVQFLRRFLDGSLEMESIEIHAI